MNDIGVPEPEDSTPEEDADTSGRDARDDASYDGRGADAFQRDGAGDASLPDPDADALLGADAFPADASQDTRREDARGEDRPDDGSDWSDARPDRVDDGRGPDADSSPRDDGAPTDVAAEDARVPCVSVRDPHVDLPVAGGTFTMGAPSTAGAAFADAPQHAATVEPFSIDQDEVTVARFRRFVDAYACWRETHPAQGEGAIVGNALLGWKTAWNRLPATTSELRSGLTTCGADAAAPSATWNDVPDATRDAYPVNCVTWYEALAFCIWDDGRLPTEAEWEFTAAGGTQQRPYSTRTIEPFPDIVNFDMVSVGPWPESGASREAFGTRNLTGNVAEWVFDTGTAAYDTAACSGTAACALARLSPAEEWRGIRGGSWSDPVVEVRTARRRFQAPAQRNAHVGFRCAHEPKPDR